MVTRRLPHSQIAARRFAEQQWPLLEAYACEAGGDTGGALERYHCSARTERYAGWNATSRKKPEPAEPRACLRRENVK